MPERNRVQAMFPRGSRVIPNPAGTAPGIDIDIPRPGKRPARIFALPGVPAEMFEMWEQTVAPAIAGMFGAPQVIRHKQIKCFGVGESDLEADAARPDPPRPRSASRHYGERRHDHAADHRRGATADECYRKMEPTIDTIHECLGDLVFGEGADELEHAVLRLLVEQFKTLATAEWGSGGMIAHWFSEVPESGGQFRGGVVVRDGNCHRFWHLTWGHLFCRVPLLCQDSAILTPNTGKASGTECDQDQIVGAMAQCLSREIQGRLRFGRRAIAGRKSATPLSHRCCTSPWRDQTASR